MKNRIGKLIAIVFIAYASLFLYQLTGGLFLRDIRNEFLQEMLAQLYFAFLVLLAVLVLRKMDLFRFSLNDLKEGWTSAGLLVFMIYFIFRLASKTIGTLTVSRTDFLYFMIHMLLIGFSEEVVFRGLIQTAFHRFFKEETRTQVFLAILCSGIAFGLTHLVNSRNPEADFFDVFYQVIATIFMGFYLGAIYFRTGRNIWYMILLHALYDAAGFILSGRLTGSSTYSILAATGDGGIAGVLLWVVIYAAATLIVLRPKKIDPLLDR